MVTISLETLEKILYHLNGFMRLMGFGGEFSKIVKLINELPLENIDLSEFQQIKMFYQKKGE